MIKIIQATIQEHDIHIRDLFAEYIRWVCPKIYQEYGAVFDAESIIVHDMQTIDIFLPPKGFLLLAFEDDVLAGCACTRTIGEKMAELKRMYVRPMHRRKGIGAELVQESINQVKKRNYSTMRLDSAGFMTDAHRLYHSLGFKDIAPYNGSEIPEEYRKYWVFMQLDLI